MPMATREEQREYGRQWIARRRAAYLEGKSCVLCGSTGRLEVDHIDPSTKVDHKVWSWSAERRKAELAKCQILCKDCHREKTTAERGHSSHGTWGYRNGCRCTECKAAHAASNYRWRHKGLDKVRQA